MGVLSILKARQRILNAGPLIALSRGKRFELSLLSTHDKTRTRRSYPISDRKGLDGHLWCCRRQVYATRPREPNPIV